MGVINSTQIEGITVQLDLRDDGVYLVIERPVGNGSKVDFASVRSLIDSCGIKDWDFAAVLDASESMTPEIDILISYDTDLKRVDESAEVVISPDRMTAEIVFANAINGGKRMYIGDIREQLVRARVVSGINDNLIRLLAEDRKYGVAYTVAEGQLPVNGEDGRIEFLFNTGPISRRPKELEDGTIDYLNLDVFQVAPKGRVLANITPPEEGIDGFNVMGEVLKATNGKDVLNPVGKNVTMSEDGLAVTSDIDGQIIFQNNKINMSPILEIGGDVDNSTGNINFLGTVVIRKNVLSGFTVTATGNIEINGVVECATIISDSDIFIRGGVQGMNKAQITAKGSITAKFIENSTVYAGEDLMADSIVRSSIKCGGSLVLAGKRGQLIGGSVKVLNAVNAITLGSQIEASTEVQAGLDPDLYDLYMAKRTELAKLKKELSQLNQIINALAKAKQEGKLTQAKKAILVKSLQSKNHMKTKVAELYAEIEELIPKLTKGGGVVKVQKFVNPGVKITIGNAILYVKNKLENCSFTNVDGEIRMGGF